MEKSGNLTTWERVREFWLEHENVSEFWLEFSMQFQSSSLLAQFHGREKAIFYIFYKDNALTKIIHV